jgi:hypothetical protein
MDARADMKGAKLAAERIQREVKRVLDGVSETQKSHERAKSSLQGAIETKGQTLQVVASMKG